MMHRFAWSGVIILAACAPAVTAGSSDARATSSSPRAVEDTPVSRAAAAFAGVERRLLAARSVRLDFEVTATGVVEADLRGDLIMGGDGEIELGAVGTFAGQPVELVLRTTGDRYLFGSAVDPAESGRPDQLREALLIGLTRMGILHNLARLTGGAPPDRAGGGVTEWVRAESFSSDPAEPDAIVFGVRVSGQAVGSAVLVPGPDGLPRLRRQTVRFPEGEMRVVERYSAVAVRP